MMFPFKAYLVLGAVLLHGSSFPYQCPLSLSRRRLEVSCGDPYNLLRLHLRMPLYSVLR